MTMRGLHSVDWRKCVAAEFILGESQTQKEGTGYPCNISNHSPLFLFAEGCWSYENGCICLFVVFGKFL